jgi:hypothetical protein
VEAKGGANAGSEETVQHVAPVNQGTARKLNNDVTHPQVCLKKKAPHDNSCAADKLLF